MSDAAPFEMDLTVTADDGVTVPVQIVMTYPAGYGLYAVKAVEKLAEQTGVLYQEMVTRNDLSTMMALAKLSDGDDDE